MRREPHRDSGRAATARAERRVPPRGRRLSRESRPPRHCGTARLRGYGAARRAFATRQSAPIPTSGAARAGAIGRSGRRVRPGAHPARVHRVRASRGAHKCSGQADRVRVRVLRQVLPLHPARCAAAPGQASSGRRRVSHQRPEGGAELNRRRGEESALSLGSQNVKVLRALKFSSVIAGAQVHRTIHRSHSVTHAKVT